MGINMTRQEWLVTIVNAALSAGKEILAVYNSEFTIEEKSDLSPLTEADKRAHIAIVKALETTNLPILSEEGKIPRYEDRKYWKQFWMVDPLDGTKEFVKRNGEFTVNIALIENGKPTMGVIYIPVSKELYFSDTFAYKIEDFTTSLSSFEQLNSSAQKLPFNQTRKNHIILASRSHLNDETKNFIEKQKEQHKASEIVCKGSSLKFCLIAEGSADIYPRFSPTMEWDTAAAHAILNASGGEIINWETKNSLQYNKKDLLNPSFIVNS